MRKNLSDVTDIEISNANSHSKLNALVQGSNLEFIGRVVAVILSGSNNPMKCILINVILDEISDHRRLVGMLTKEENAENDRIINELRLLHGKVSKAAADIFPASQKSA